jgi:hypothetical protein
MPIGVAPGTRQTMVDAWLSFGRINTVVRLCRDVVQSGRRCGRWRRAAGRR